MVSYKRQPVTFLSNPNNLRDSDEVWVMRLSNEIFTDYESYLERLNFLSQKKFTCDVTGRSGLTFFQAKESEMAGSHDSQVALPAMLREHILHSVHHTVTPRLDDLVNLTYEALQTEFFPQETVLCTNPEMPTSSPATILEKVDIAFGGFNNRPNVLGPSDPVPSGAPFTRYRVLLQNGNECFAFPTDLRRDRRSFNKLVLRSFLKHAISREPIRGAPWQVKPSLCQEFNLPNKLPDEFVQWHSKALKNTKTAYRIADKENSFNNFALSQKSPLSIRPARPRPGQAALVPHPLHPQNMQQTPITNYFYQGGQPAFQATIPVHQIGPHSMLGGSQMNGVLQFSNMTIPQGPFQAQQIQPRVVIAQNSRKAAKHSESGKSKPQAVAPPRPPSPPPIKYPIEDLDVIPYPGTRTRPPLKYFHERVSGLQDSHMTSLLDCWVTLNVHHDFFVMDTFTIDDFAEAMGLSEIDVESELFIEIHCAVLKRLVDRNGYLLARGMESDEEESESEETDESAESRPPTPPPARSTRSSLAKAEADRLRRSPSPKVTNRAREMLTEFDWISQLKDRSFGDGGWEMIMVGVLRHASLHAPYLKDKCQKLLAHLAPSDMEPDLNTLVEQYATMDINLRIEALEIILGLVFSTKDFQEHLKACAVRQTEIRREVNEKKREKNALVEDMIKLDNERKIMAPEYLKDTQDEQQDISLTNVDEEEKEEDEEEDSSDEDAPVVRMRTLRNAEKREEERRRKKEEREAKEAAKKARKRQLNPYEQILEKIDALKADIKDHEEQILDCMQQIKELNVTRIEPLGSDRWGNSYFFYERNGIPLGGDPDSSTGHYDYLSGRLWVRGPLASTYQSNMNLPDSFLVEHKKIFGMSPLERKARDEGETGLTDSDQWGYFDTPDDLDKLLAWLDERGERELKLKRDLTKFKAAIVDCMNRMNKHLSEVEEQKRAASEEAESRMSTRKRTYHEHERDFLCLQWTNSRALKEQGYLHSQEPQKKRKLVKRDKYDASQNRGNKAKKDAKDAVASESQKPEKRETRSGRGKR